MLASTEIQINCLGLKVKVLEIIRAWGFGVNSSISFHLWLSSKYLMASSSIPNIYPITATAENQFPVGQCNSNRLFPSQLCFTNSLLEAVLCINAFLCGKGWKCSSYILTIFHAKKPQRSFLMAMWEQNLWDTLWMVLRAGGRLNLIPTCSPWKTAGGQVIPILKWNPNKTHSAGRKKGKWNKHSKPQPNIKSFSPSLVSSLYSQKTVKTCTWLRVSSTRGFPMLFV